jgi:quercetin dioxygenase-like cupin family protein
MNPTPAVPIHTFTIDRVQVNVYRVNKGEGLPKHEHLYSHITVCHAGSLIVRKENKQLEVNPDTQPISLKENEWHELEALEDGTCFTNIFQIA